ncbi:hypothetical protein [Nocardia sp. NPDC051750]|uniref:hypothetical protein n=1 Tax=Nocardia sp. NPDC051750 TaxID=3364325 RepID=UPI0037A84DE4
MSPVGLFDAVVSPVGDWIGDNWDTIAVGAVSVAGFAVGGPLGAAAAGAAVGGLAAWAQGEDVGAAIAMGALGGALGGVGGAALRGGLSAAGRTAISNFTRRSGTALVRGRMGGAGLIRGSGGGYLRSVRRQLPNRLAGSVGAGLGAGGLYWGETMDMPGSGDADPADIGDIPVSPIGQQGRPERMPEILMPDPSKAGWPEGLTFSEPMQQNYNTLPDLYYDIWKSFGKDPTESGLPEESKLPGEIADPEKAGVPNYTQRVSDLEISFENLRSFDEQVATAVKRTVEYCDAGKNDIRGSVSTLGKFAVIHPENIEKIGATHEGTAGAEIPVFVFPETYGADGSFTEDSYAFSMIEGAYAGAESIMGAYAELFAALAAETTPPEEPEDKETPTAPETPATPTTPGAPTVPSIPTAPGVDSPTLQSPTPIDLGDDADSAAGSAADKANEAAQQQLEQMGRDAAAAQAAGAPMAGTAGSGLESMMLPMMMQAMMGAMGGANQQRAQVPDEPRRRRREDENQPQAPAAAPVPGGVPQAAAPPTSAPPAGTQPPAARPPAPPATQGPATPGKPPARGEGNIVYTFPDGRTQEVSAVVAQALDAAFGNASRTDAKEAYANTKVTWTDEKEIGTRVDPYQLMTGDVGVWDGRTALLVVFGTDTSGTLEAVVDGQLQPVVGPAEMRDGQGEFGAFVGFFHPPGIEKAADDPGVPETQTAAPVPDQSIAVAPA